MALTRAEETQLGVLKTKQESSDTFGPLTPKEQKTLEELEQKQGNQSSLFDNLGIFSTAQASEINPNNPPSILSTGAMDRETPFGDMLQPTIPSGGSIFSGREFGDIRAGREDQGIFGSSAGQRFNIENNPELFFNTAAGQTRTDEEQDFFDYLQNLSGGAVDFGKDLAGRYIASNVGAKALGSFNPYLGAAAGIAGLFGGGDMFTPSQSQIDFNALTPEGKAAVGDIYGPGGIMSGYNAVSAFGRGPVGAIDARLDKLGTRRAPQTDFSRQRAKDLFAAREKIMQTTLDSDNRYTGPTSSVRGQKAGVMDDDPFATGPSGTTGESSKIVCTMMNESYGFGNFRNKIWLKHSKDLPKEYEKGYHKIFLPLVKFAKGQGKLNKAVKKTLEHVARHRTLDLKQEMKGKTHLLGRIYRKILEPICFIVGKVSNNV